MDFEFKKMPDLYKRDKNGRCIGWSIRYTDKRTGCKHWYMNVLFHSAESADNELKLIKKSMKKYKDLGTFIERLHTRGCFKIIKRK